MAVQTRSNVHLRGPSDAQPMVFAHGFGCDQHMWRHLVPHFEDRYRVVLFDHVGAGDSDLSAYDPERYSTLDDYADDVVELCDALGLDDVIFVGHSVSAARCRAHGELLSHRPRDPETLRPGHVPGRQPSGSEPGADTVLVLQCSDDVIAPVEVGRYIHEHLADSTCAHWTPPGTAPT